MTTYIFCANLSLEYKTKKHCIIHIILIKYGIILVAMCPRDRQSVLVIAGISYSPSTKNLPEVRIQLTANEVMTKAAVTF